MRSARVQRRCINITVPSVTSSAFNSGGVTCRGPLHARPPGGGEGEGEGEGEGARGVEGVSGGLVCV